MTRAAELDRQAGALAGPSDAVTRHGLWCALALTWLIVMVTLLPWAQVLVAIAVLVPVLAIARADLDDRAVPDIWVLSLAGLGLCVAAASAENGWFGVGTALLRTIGSVAVATCLGYLAGRIANDGEPQGALGAGDLGVIGVAALWLPLTAWLAAVQVSSLAATLVVMARSRGVARVERTNIPYAAFLVLAAYAVGLIVAVQTESGWADIAAGG